MPGLASDDVVIRERRAKLLPALLEVLALAQLYLEAVDDDLGLECGYAAVGYPIGRPLELVGQKGGSLVAGVERRVKIGNRSIGQQVKVRSSLKNPCLLIGSNPSGKASGTARVMSRASRMRQA